jgi:hypothetical protein
MVCVEATLVIQSFLLASFVALTVLMARQAFVLGGPSKGLELTAR